MASSGADAGHHPAQPPLLGRRPRRGQRGSVHRRARLGAKDPAPPRYNRSEAREPSSRREQVRARHHAGRSGVAPHHPPTRDQERLSAPPPPPTKLPGSSGRLARRPAAGQEDARRKTSSTMTKKPLRNQLSTSGKKNWWERRTASPAHDPTQRKSTTSPRSDQRSRPERQEPSISHNRVALVSTVHGKDWRKLL